MKITTFLKDNFKHFNAASLIDAAEAYQKNLDAGNKMLISLAGAMSTAELGISLAEMIREDKVHIISCTGANLEEDIFNLIAHHHYERVPRYRDMTPKDEKALFDRKMNRVTDTCIPEDEAVNKLSNCLFKEWKKADNEGKSYFPHEFFYKVLLSGELEKSYQIDPKNSWLLEAAKKNLPIVVPGWEDSTLANYYAALCFSGDIKSVHTVRSGVEYMTQLAKWYIENTREKSVGFFQIGGGIAGDFPICVVPLIYFNLERTDVKLWSYFCQISDSITSYGSYSGAVPNEKITWGKLGVDTPKFIIESDATIVAPLIFAIVLGK